MIRSPCIGVCTLDERTGACAGCHRTLDEIASWPALSDDERRALVARLAARRAHREHADAPNALPATPA